MNFEQLEQLEPSAHMYPSDLEKFKESETFATAFSVAVGNQDERSVPLFSLEGRLGDCAKACEGISDEALKSWLNPPEGQLGHPHGTWAAQLAEVGRQQVEMQKRIDRLISTLRFISNNSYDSEAVVLATAEISKAEAA